jgi:hypothetical protein
MRQINKEMAGKIADKLGANVEKGARGHERAMIYEDGVLVASFGIRRGSNKEQGHDHIPGELYTSMSNTKLLARCPMSRQQWIDVLKSKDMV